MSKPQKSTILRTSLLRTRDILLTVAAPLAVGMFFGTLLHVFTGLLGFHPTVLTGFFLALTAIGWLSLFTQSSTMPRWLAAGVCLAWMAGLPWLTEMINGLLPLLSQDLVTQTAGPILAGFFTTILLMLVPALVARQVVGPVTSTGHVWAGIGLGLLVHALIAAPFMGVYGSLFVAAGFFVCGALAKLQSATNDRLVSGSAVRSGSWQSVLLLVSAGIGIGACLIFVMHLSASLFPASAYLRDGVAGTACLIFAAGYTFAQRPPARESSGKFARAFSAVRTFFHRNAFVAGIGLCVGLAVVACMFPVWLRLTLAGNASIATPLLLMISRIAIVSVMVGFVLFPIALLCGQSACRQRMPILLSFAAIGAALMCFLRAIQLPLGAAVWVVAVPLAITGLLACIHKPSSEPAPTPEETAPKTPRRMWLWRAFAACLITTSVAGLPLALEQMQRPMAARLLFSTRVFLAWKRGLETAMLPFVDDSRLVAERESAAGYLTVWRRRGAQLQVRRDGFPVGHATLDAALCPRANAEILPAILPLTLHDNPETVLAAGLGSGETVKAALAFPIQSVTVLDSDRELFEQLQSEETPVLRDVADDVRLQTIFAEPSLLMAQPGEKYDVVVSSPPQATTLAAQPYYTREFYERAATRLADEGIFCQRFEQIDFGPEPIRQLVATMSSVFNDVIAIETVPGSMLLLGSNSDWGLIRAGLTDRFQRTHVLSLLTEAGQDWTIVLNHPAIRQTRGDENLPPVNAPLSTVLNGRLAYSLPGEMMRWGNKMREVRDGLAEHTERLLAWMPADSDKGEIKRRIGDVIEQRELISEFPDEPWIYRVTLKSRLERNPRPPIQVVEGGKIKHVIHPTTKQRKDYLKALSAAVTTKSPDSINELASFAATTDPLINFFAHHEAAELYSRIEEPASELAHRLHTIYYAGSDDRSLRNVIRSLQLMIEHPQLNPDTESRADEINCLLQMLLVRWEKRHALAARSGDVALNDIGKSIQIVEAALKTLAEISPDEVSTAQRTEFLEDSLIAPLRTYRSDLLKHKRETDLRLAKERLKRMQHTAN